MKNFKKEHYSDATGDSYDFILTHDIGLTAVLGSMGHKVHLEKKKDTYFPLYRILVTEKINEDINSYYLGSLKVDASILTADIEILSNILCSYSDSFNVVVPMKSLPIENMESAKGSGDKKPSEIEADDESCFAGFYRNYSVDS